jgi:hypothetical protein
MGSTKMLLQRQQSRQRFEDMAGWRLCLVPHTVPFSWTAIVGLSNRQ